MLICLGFITAAIFFSGCRTMRPLPPVDTTQPGWRLQQGQALWRPKADGPEIAGEVLFASHPDGRTLLQFTKNPLPFVTVQTSNEVWQIDFVPQQRTFSGRGIPTGRLIWVHLARGLRTEPVARFIHFRELSQGDWEILNTQSGEKVSGFLNP